MSLYTHVPKKEHKSASANAAQMKPKFVKAVCKMLVKFDPRGDYHADKYRSDWKDIDVRSDPGQSNRLVSVNPGNNVFNRHLPTVVWDWWPLTYLKICRWYCHNNLLNWFKGSLSRHWPRREHARQRLGRDDVRDDHRHHRHHPQRRAIPCDVHCHLREKRKNGSNIFFTFSHVHLELQHISVLKPLRGPRLNSN